jgi:predicted MPP superfamily phosphohydrolase
MNRSYFAFLTIFCSVLFATGAYITFRLASGYVSAVLIGAPFLIVAFGFVRMITSRKSKQGKKISRGDLLFQQLNFILMGWLSFLFLFTILRDILGVIGLFTSDRFAVAVLSEQGACAVLICSAVAMVVGVYPAWRGPRVKYVTVPIENLKSELSGFKIAQISDLHIGPFIGALYSKKVVDAIRELNPSIIALTGDIFDSDFEHFHPQAAPLAELAEFSKVFFVSGNHEYYWESAKWFDMGRGFGFQFLQNENRVLDFNGAKILVGGIVDFAARMIGEEPSSAAAAKGDADFKILLAHQPQVADRAVQNGFDLQLSGHTHGGQFFPWTLVVRKVHKYHQGLFRVAGKMWIYVSPGTGFWGPPVRLGTTPEITLLTITKK